VQWTYFTQERKCNLTLHTKLSPHPVHCTIEAQEFDIDEFLPQIQIFLLPNESQNTLKGC
jgi:hypothetical protein